MQRGAALLLGQHDFRNLCQVDVKARQTWTRTFTVAEIGPCKAEHHIHICFQPVFTVKKPQFTATTESVYVATFTANSFLWHQIRFIMAALFHIGRNLERPELISQLLDIESVPGKPEFNMASDVPLVLQQCEFGEEVLQWRVGEGTSLAAYSIYANLWALYEKRALQAASLKGKDGAAQQKKQHSRTHTHFFLKKIDMLLQLAPPEDMVERRRADQYTRTKIYVPIVERVQQQPPAVKIAALNAKLSGMEEDAE